MIRLALLRHGHTPWNREGRIQGSTDIPLDTDAAANLARHSLPPPWDSADICSSPLLRAAHTAELVSGRRPKTYDALREMHWGDWEGQKGAELRAAQGTGFKDIEDWGWNYTPPGGEPPAALRARLAPWIATLERDTVAVCHIGVMRVVLAMATGWAFRGPAPFQVKRNRLFILQVTPGSLTLEADTPRLVERPA